MKWVKSSFTLAEGSWCEPYINNMKAWKHILKTEDLGIVIASSRRAAEKLWKKHFPQSEEPDSCYFLEESTDFSKIEGPECVKDWNDQLSRRYLMEHSMRLMSIYAHYLSLKEILVRVAYRGLFVRTMNSQIS